MQIDTNNEREVKIDGNKIIYEANFGINDTEIYIENLQYAYVLVNAKKQSSLFLFDHHQHTIPTNYSGFQEVYKALSDRFSFNDALFFESITNGEVVKKEIWRRTYEPTYSLLNGDFNDYDKGFEIQSPQPQFIPWETTYKALEKNEAVYFATSPYGQKLLKYKYPIRIGNLLFNDLASYFDDVRKDAPVLEFHTDCFDKNGTDKSYNELKQVLVRDLGIDKNKAGYERADQNNIYFNLSGISLSLCYTYDSTWQYNGGYTLVSIKNLREYPAFLIDAAYEQEIVISNYLILPGSIYMPANYKINERVKRRAQKISDQFQDKTVIWIDDANNKIGFACDQFSQVYDKDEIKALGIQNVLPARGPGSGNLELILEQGINHYEIFTEKCHFFDAYAEKIKTLLQKELTFGEEYHDC